MSSVGCTQRLWDIEHPYHCDYRNAEAHEKWDCWKDFSEGMGKSDPERNLLFRWDWSRGHEDGEWDGIHRLQLFFILQRKGLYVYHEVVVTEEDEPQVRAWLDERSNHILALWPPLIGRRDLREAAEKAQNVYANYTGLPGWEHLREDTRDMWRGVVTAVLASVSRPKSVAEEALDDIAAMCGISEWSYPGQVVRDVAGCLAGNPSFKPNLKHRLIRFFLPEGALPNEIPRSGDKAPVTRGMEVWQI